MEQLEQEKQGVYRYISELFGVAELPADVLAGVSRELNSGKTPRGACATLRYYYAVEGNLPTNINSVPYIIRDYYEVAREYVRKSQQLKKKNAEKVGKKIRDARLEKLPVWITVGDKEVEGGTVSVTSRREGDLGSMTQGEMLSKLLDDIAKKVR